MKIRLGTRGSRLALTQSNWVADQIRASSSSIEVELVEIVTAGDREKSAFLGPQLGQSFFTREIEDALLDGRIDIAVHSCKDLATTLPPGLSLGAIPPREDPRDAIVTRGPKISELPDAARVGTSSPRRRGFLKHAFPGLIFADQRGNVPTRVAAVDRGEYSATVLAAAGLNRLNLAHRITEVLSPDTILPAASQGALAVQVRLVDRDVLDAVAFLDHQVTRTAVMSERACLRRLEAGCQAPIGTLGRVDESGLTLDAAVATPERIVRVRCTGTLDSPDHLGDEAAEGLLRQLGVTSLKDVDDVAATPDAATPDD